MRQRMTNLTRFILLLFISIIYVTSCNGGCYRSCLQIKRSRRNAPSGLYFIYVKYIRVKVYCEMKYHGGGYTFIPTHAVRRGRLTTLIRQVFKNKKNVLLRIQKRDGSQPFTLISQLYRNRRIPLKVLMHSYVGYTRPLNYYLRDYLFLGILPKWRAQNKAKQGFRSNYRKIVFKNCDKNPNSYFAFFPNHKGITPSTYLKNNLVFERRGVAVDWRKTGLNLRSYGRLPCDFFFLTELHFGGCGTYTSSDRWTDATGTAIGLR
ncbi:uncharacterized protein LOC124457519 [Xenia sp. Carnegie-2017]|uniref:uncharacterized protein LOC124457519 n=1 Tax=Xenia sp. Carnegie-2017 TaxID=2897299 RepID=UPI001F036F5E|nr:uncharacterized protein LOC124457519 [Xenia sp. Carnegie-2017]